MPEHAVLTASFELDVALLGIGDLVHLLAAARTVHIPDLVELLADLRIAVVDEIRSPLVLQLFRLSRVEPEALAGRALVVGDESLERAHVSLVHGDIALRTIHLAPLFR